MRFLLLLMTLVCSPAFAQKANYRGRTYTPETFTTASRSNPCRCAMCNNIRAQWSAQGWVTGYGSNKVMAQPAAQPAAQPEYRLVTKTRMVSRTVKRCNGRQCWYETIQVPETYQVRELIKKVAERGYRLVTKTRMVSRTVKRCNGRQCWYETIQVPETYQVKEPVAVQDSTSKEPVADQVQDSTPKDVVDAMLMTMQVGPNDTIYDIGSGPDARFLIRAAQKYGSRGVGIEIDPERAELSRSIVRAAGLSDRIFIVTADALKTDFSGANKVVLYQYDDLMRDIIERLPAGTLIGSYAHEPPITSTSYRVGDNTFYVGRKE